METAQFWTLCSKWGKVSPGHLLTGELSGYLGLSNNQLDEYTEEQAGRTSRN